MNTFRTVINIPQSSFQIDHQTQLMLIGSCFAENIGERLDQYKFPIIYNPFGIIYNPISVKNSLELLIKQNKFTKKDLIQTGGLWSSFSHHSRFSSLNIDNCLKFINNSIISSSKQLKNTDYLFITFGTSYVYKYKKTDKIVSNCHKIPAKEFNRYRLSVSDIIKEYDELINKLRSYNKKIKLVFTVSPIRHWKDGATDNQISKSILLVAIDEIKAKHKNVEYFPAYEIMMDELRDYRFYAEDMLHPSQIAINFIWERFKETYIHEKSYGILKDLDKLKSAISHKPFNPESEEHKKFQKKQLVFIKGLSKKLPKANFEKETGHFTK
ncbi:MAG: GSCFA domain protein [Bacteroidetes bacterium]|nr:MAG: GSCFA domain protein [Bacteroidota bacterium]